MRRRSWTRCGVILCLLAMPAFTTAQQEVGKDVPPGHWAYQAVQDLASKGLIKGYPPDANFLGRRTLTRYEMATILQRVV
ncbi:MAG TPA: S-layer homology domain-containing protein, partial [Chthonomonadaceae bacterium]|nr:S-layer homology domain-containing protein [Chthonomonadaceae bacterium]